MTVESTTLRFETIGTETARASSSVTGSNVAEPVPTPGSPMAR